MCKRERPHALCDAALHTSQVKNSSPGCDLVWKLHGTGEKGQGRHTALSSEDKLQRTAHAVWGTISEETKTPPLRAADRLPCQTPTSPREADEELFLLVFSSGKRSWRARRPILSSCSTEERRRRRAGGYRGALLPSRGNAQGTALQLRRVPLTARKHSQLQALIRQPPLSPSRCRMSRSSPTLRRYPREAQAGLPQRGNDITSPPPTATQRGLRAPRLRSCARPAGVGTDRGRSPRRLCTE